MKGEKRENKEWQRRKAGKPGIGRNLRQRREAGKQRSEKRGDKTWCPRASRTRSSPRDYCSVSKYPKTVRTRSIVVRSRTRVQTTNFFSVRFQGYPFPTGTRMGVDTHDACPPRRTGELDEDPRRRSRPRDPCFDLKCRLSVKNRSFAVWSRSLEQTAGFRPFWFKRPTSLQVLPRGWTPGVFTPGAFGGEKRWMKKKKRKRSFRG